MEDKLTKENLQNLGFKEDDVNKLLNTTENYTLQCNEGNIFVSKDENKLFTGVNFYRKTYFTEKSIRFPFRCPDLFDEYFNLSLAKFFERQKAQLSIHFDERTQFNKFIGIETERSKESIKDNKDYIKAHPQTRWEGKERTINILETYIQFLENKLLIVKKQDTDINTKKQPKPEKAFFDFIKNVKDKKAFAEDLKNTFSTAYGKDFTAIISVLENAEIFEIPDQGFKAFYETLKTYFNREIGTRQSISSPRSIQKLDGLSNIEKNKISYFSEMLNPLIIKHKIKQ